MYMLNHWNWYLFIYKYSNIYIYIYVYIYIYIYIYIYMCVCVCVCVARERERGGVREKRFCYLGDDELSLGQPSLLLFNAECTFILTNNSISNNSV